MITYESGGVYHILNLLKFHGSVLPQACRISIPCAILTAILAHNQRFPLSNGFTNGLDYHNRDEASVLIMSNNAVWGGFSFLVGFLVVFRTSQAYNRFWEGCTSMTCMGGEWFLSCASLISFCKTSTADPQLVMRFQNMCIRLFSILHAVALGEIEDSGDSLEFQEIEAFNMEVIDASSLDDTTLKTLRDCDSKVQLTLFWIQQLVVDNIKTQVLQVPPPILTRAFEELATGMVRYHDAMKISNVPFPFPYAQTCDGILLFHWLVAPAIVTQWIAEPWWAAIFGFLNVFTFWTLNLIAVELENPFGTDPNDIDARSMQLVMNHHLRLLVSEPASRGACVKQAKSQDPGTMLRSVVFPSSNGLDTKTLNELWQDIDGSPTESKNGRKTTSPVARAFTVNNIKKSIVMSDGEDSRRTVRIENGYDITRGSL